MDPILIGKFIYEQRVKNNLTQKELSIKITDTNKNISPEMQHQQIPVDVFSECRSYKKRRMTNCKDFK